MTTAVPPTSMRALFPLLEHGDHIDQATFHARYINMPSRVRAELLRGIVFTPSPVRADHSQIHARLVGWLQAYVTATPGIDAFDNATTILSAGCEVQPDLSAVISGSNARINNDGYVQGPPDWICEVASSSEAYDLYEKRDEYEKYGVREYLVILLRESRVLLLGRKSLEELLSEVPAGADGVLRSNVLPGLWLDSAALFRGDLSTLSNVSQAGIASPEHAAFITSRR